MTFTRLALKPFITALCSLAIWGISQHEARAFAYVFAGEANGIDIVTHSMGYTGTGGVIQINIGIDPTSANAAAMEISTQNAVQTWNQLQTTTGNLVSGGANNIPTGSMDYESVLLHEMGHALGLTHVNAATESSLIGDDREYTKATNGVDNVFNLDAGADGVRGSHDDIRGDDVNLNYFKVADNNPFTIPGSDVIDSTTYSRDTANLPGADTFSTNPDRDVSALARYNVANTEAAMQQGSAFDEAQRTLTADDVAGIRYAMSGIDEIQGTADDYTLELIYAGQTAAADIVIDFDDTQTGFAVTQLGGSFISADHLRVTAAPIYFNTGYNWFFNDEPLLLPIPEPGRTALAMLGFVAVLLNRRRSDLV